MLRREPFPKTGGRKDENADSILRSQRVPVPSAIQHLGACPAYYEQYYVTGGGAEGRQLQRRWLHGQTRHDNDEEAVGQAPVRHGI